MSTINIKTFVFSFSKEKKKISRDKKGKQEIDYLKLPWFHLDIFRSKLLTEALTREDSVYVTLNLREEAEEQESGGYNPTVRQSRKLAADFSFLLYGSFTGSRSTVGFCG